MPRPSEPRLADPCWSSLSAGLAWLLMGFAIGALMNGCLRG